MRYRPIGVEPLHLLALRRRAHAGKDVEVLLNELRYHHRADAAVRARDEDRATHHLRKLPLVFALQDQLAHEINHGREEDKAHRNPQHELEVADHR